jgi:hypothetical protein
MPIPTLSDLQHEEVELTSDLARLQKAYDAFVKEWNAVDKHSATLHRELAAHIDRTKTAHVLKTIANIQNTPSVTNRTIPS